MLLYTAAYQITNELQCFGQVVVFNFRQLKLLTNGPIASSPESQQVLREKIHEYIPLGAFPDTVSERLIYYSKLIKDVMNIRLMCRSEFKRKENLDLQCLMGGYITYPGHTMRSYRMCIVSFALATPKESSSTQDVVTTLKIPDTSSTKNSSTKTLYIEV